jgi:peptidoglycan hydrolase-like protein with peptidoglycan-binding domain
LPASIIAYFLLTTFLAYPVLANTSIPDCPDIHRDLSFTDPLMEGNAIVQMQLNLKQAGILPGRADGRYGTGTEIFVKRCQALTGEEITGEFTKDDYTVLAQLLDRLA